ncbi:MAG: GTPase-activating protein [Vezdaea aestivalis]|nr:MAG: GTPase-activating protein [Vezdaea aestivalis]
MVVGAAYSHADMLKSFGSSSSRPHTPPSAQASKTINTPPSSKEASALSSPPRQGYKSFLSKTADEWTADEEEDEDDVAGEERTYELSGDEDEFGLPSIPTAARRGKRLVKRIPEDPGGGGFGSLEGPSWQAGGPMSTFGRRRANSSDIAEERGGSPSYPVPKKSEGKILRPQYKDILRGNHPPIPPNATPKEKEAHSSRITRINKFKRILQMTSIPFSELRDSAWSGAPGEVRAMTWQLLLGYLPTSSERRVSTLDRKRKEYLDGVRQAFDKGASRSSSPKLSGGSTQSPNSVDRGRGLDEAVWHQISIDVPRTNPHLELYSFEATQRSLERILYVWAIRHPASGYVQGINDLVTPFWQVFLGTYITDPDIDHGMDPGQLPKAVLDAVEADSFWCLTKLLDGIQDNYIYAQPGIVRQVGDLKDLVMRIDAGLAKHLQDEGIEFMQFSFRWMNCLLMREISVDCTIRMWDTYLAEENGFSSFHLYVCAAFLVKWSEQLVKMDFQEIMMFLQALPTRNWTAKDIELLLSEAFIWQSLFRGSSAHLRNSGGGSSSGGGGMGGV